MRKFKTESKKLLDLMINSIYTNKEIFLRELISNASDAVDKLYFKSLTDSSVQLSKDDLCINVAFDKDARTITVSDNGIGMTKDDLDRDLGTIAHSDSFEFMKDEEAKNHDDIDIIGQFGVGFYSAFMVADRVRVVTRAFGQDEAWQWESDGVEGYTITEASREASGTDVILEVKPNTEGEDYDHFLTEDGLKQLIKRYSNYVRYPIHMMCSKKRELPKPEDAGDDYKPEYEDYLELETINSMTPIWKRAKKDVSQEDYDEFYKTTFHDYEAPARTITLHAEGKLEYDALLFIPSRRPFDLYSKDYKKGLQLYSSNVLIMDKCEELLPDYFNFVHGVVDSQDLNLNISRETLQHNGQLHAIASRIEKKVKGDLEDMRDNDREAYEQFFDQFGRGIEYGIYSSYGMNGADLGDLLLFHSAKTGKMVTLSEYLEDAGGDDAKAIYYAAGDSIDKLSRMPVVTTVVGRGYDVLLCTQDVDEFCLTALREWNGKPLQNVAGGDLGLETDEEKTQAEEAEKENADLFTAMKDELGDKVSKVTVSTRLTDSPVCMTSEGPISLEMEKVLAAEPDANGMKSQRVLEINAKHPIFEALKAAQGLGDADKVKLYTNILYDQALLVEGFPLDDPLAYAENVCKLMD